VRQQLVEQLEHHLNIGIRFLERRLERRSHRTRRVPEEARHHPSGTCPN
jgi:hypothetical protein